MVGSGAEARTLGPDLFDLAVATALYDTTLWGTLAVSIAELDDGGASTLLSLVDRQTGRQPDGSYDNSSDAQTMVSCADTDERPSVDEATATAERILTAAPTFGPITGFGALGCLGWPAAANPLPTITGAGSPTILVVGTVGDPATPYEWAQQMSDTLESAVLLTYEGDGHTAFLRGGACIEDAVVEYLVDLSAPAPGTRCPAEESEAGFTSIRDEVLTQFEDAGIPEEVANCVIEGIIAELGESGFNELILSGDQEQLTRLVTAQAVRCAAAAAATDRSAEQARRAPHRGDRADHDHRDGAPERWPRGLLTVARRVLGRAHEREQRTDDQGRTERQDHPGQEVLAEEELGILLLGQPHARRSRRHRHQQSHRRVLPVGPVATPGRRS